MVFAYGDPGVTLVGRFFAFRSRGDTVLPLSLTRQGWLPDCSHDLGICLKIGLAQRCMVRQGLFKQPTAPGN